MRRVRPAGEVLLIDLGNSRIKWARWRDGRLGPARASGYASWTSEDFARRVFSPAPARAFVVSVAAAAVERRLAAAARRASGSAPRFIRTTRHAAGVTTRYSEPWRLGVDRFVGVIAAHRLAGSHAVCVVSAGTAVTIDLVDARGVHRGGVILPGADLMVRSLLTSTAGIERRARGGGSGGGLFARSTAAAIAEGARYALAAVIERAVAEARLRLAQTPILVLTGGALRELQPLLQRAYVHVPQLVLLGAALYAGLPVGGVAGHPRARRSRTARSR